MPDGASVAATFSRMRSAARSSCTTDNDPTGAVTSSAANACAGAIKQATTINSTIRCTRTPLDALTANDSGGLVLVNWPGVGVAPMHAGQITAPRDAALRIVQHDHGTREDQMVDLILLGAIGASVFGGWRSGFIRRLAGIVFLVVA